MMPSSAVIQQFTTGLVNCRITALRSSSEHSSIEQTSSEEEAEVDSEPDREPDSDGEP
jgi:hypothetical protein